MCNCKKQVTNDYEVFIIKKKLSTKYDNLSRSNAIDKVLLPPKETMDVIEVILKTNDLALLRLLILQLENITGIKLLLDE